ncbi:cold-shock protein [Cohnella sp.]|jgi:ABC-type ATPase with predicted acetyltransferase domain|uniref:cold-shock protein n=1 Tax=Cohnella sp. TaxID=1883426 RepID=UPI003562CABC
MHVYYSRKKPFEELPEEMTAIWYCSGEDCKRWMRDNFTFSVVPVCPECQSEMVRGERMLATLSNTSPNQAKGRR